MYLYISENKIDDTYYDSILLDKKFDKKFENYIINIIGDIEDMDPKNRFYTILFTHKISIYNKFKKMIRLRKDILLSTSNIRISLVCHNYCKYFRDYMSIDLYKIFGDLVPFRKYPKFNELCLIINGKQINVLSYPEDCFEYFYGDIQKKCALRVSV